MFHAKEQSRKEEKVGCDGRVCVAVLVDRFGTREQIDGGGYFANVANGVDRGTYQVSHVSRKGAKAQRRPTGAGIEPMSHAKAQRRKEDRQGRGSNRCLTQRSKDAKKTDRGERLFLGALSFVFLVGILFAIFAS